jgi:hypothetical protein
MDDALRVVVEMHEHLWGRLTHALADLTDEEMHWRPLPQANTINVIIRHLSIEAQWHLDSLECGEAMPTIAVAAPQEAFDAVPLDFEANVRRLEELYARFVDRLRTATLETLEQRAATAYGEAAHVCIGVSPGPPSGDALWPNPHDPQPVLQDTRGASAVLSGEPHVSTLAVDHRPWRPWARQSGQRCPAASRPSHLRHRTPHGAGELHH